MALTHTTESVMATLEIDPILRKGIRLLHSRSRDSVDQLKALLEEVHRQRQGKSLSSVKDPFSLRKESPIPRSKQASPNNILLNKGGDTKRDLTHKVRDDESQLHLPKRTKLDSPHNAFKSHTPSPTPSIKSESSSRSRKSDESDSDPDMNDLAMEIGINCTVCKSFEQTSGNQLVECQECHSLFHQECHKPAVSHQDVTDPRVVWYCAKCGRNMKKQSSLVAAGGGSSLGGMRSASVTSATSTSSKSSGNLSSNSSTSRPSPSKTIGLQRPSPFANLSSATGRSIGSTSGNNNSSSNNGNNGGSNSSTRSNISASTSRNVAAPPAANSILNAERRVHLMKKKAAAKNAERRKI